ncbi:MAG: NERD domain-containing protein [Firmicutes bacterium]|nr:NERD domain-containing protein [Bacillota bacterium]
MIKMIPPYLDSTVKSNAERKVFDLIKKSGLSGYCFHSVGLANHDYKSYAEADFIVVTEYGVLCLEIKGGQVSCQNGVWTFTNRFGKANTRNQGPFEQAVGAMHSIKDSLATFGKISFACGVIFPDIEFRSSNVSVIPEVQMDITNGGDFAAYLKACHTYWDSKFRYQPRLLKSTEIEAIREQIREDLNFVPLLSLYSQQAERELVRLTAEQADVLEGLKNNPKLLVSGPAGSGKTLLAMEYAKLKAKEGNRILFLTYNKFLATYLKANNTDENIRISSFHGLISDYITIDPNNTAQHYYDKLLPSQFVKYMASRKMVGYDILISDEGQDLLKEDFIACFDKLLKGTMSYGKWAIFYDSNQNIFNKNFDNNLARIRKHSPAELQLTKNCRNVKPIANFNNYLTNINTGKAVVDGEEIRLISYDSEADAIERINTTVQFLLTQGFSESDIVFISPVNFDRSIMNNAAVGFKLTPLAVEGKGIRYFTIQSFKGLESKIVFFVDYKDIIDSGNSQLIYTSLSRAKTLLYFFADKATSQKVQMKVIEQIASRG